MKAKRFTSFMELLIVWRKHGKIHFFDFGGFENRNESVKKMIKESLLDKENFDFRPVIINTGDRPINKHFDVNLFSFSTANGYNDKIFPDFLYDSWEAAKIPDFDIITKELIECWRKKPKVDKIGWIGNFKTSPSRRVLANLGKKYPQYLDIKDSSEKGVKWMTLHELVETYGYLIDVEGNGWSARLKLLFFSGRPVFIQERKRKDFPLSLLVPYKHYIPIKNDFSDLIEKIEKYFDSDLVHEIGKNGQNFAIKELNKEKAYEYIYNEFVNISTQKISFNNCKIILLVFIVLTRKIYGKIKSVIHF